MNTARKIFLSYSWADRATADNIERDLQEFGIQLVRDAREISYTKSIKDFMKQIRCADYVLMLISDSYLRSPKCMYEVLEFVEDEDFKDRFLPLIVGDYTILTPPKQIEYVRYWAAQYYDFKTQMQGLPPDRSIELAQHLQILHNISATTGGFLALLADISMFLVRNLNTATYWEIFKKIGLSSVELLRLCENELYSCRYTSKLTGINNKRLLLIKQLAKSGEIEEVITRRFLYSVAESVAKEVDYILASLSAFKEKDIRLASIQKLTTIDSSKLEKIISDGDKISALFSAHILIATCRRDKQNPSDNLIEDLFKANDSHKLRILAKLLICFDLTKYIEILANWTKNNIDSVSDRDSAETWTVLSQVLLHFDRNTYNQVFMLAHYKFLRFNSETAKPFMYPLLPLHNDIYVTDSDYNKALESTEREMQLAAIWMFSLKGAGITQQAQRNDSRILLSQKAQNGLRSLVKSGLDTQEKWRFCNTIIKANLHEFLDWVEQVLINGDGMDAIINMNDPNYGAYDEPQAALFLRAYGYLVRMRDENTQGTSNDKERAFLKNRWKEVVKKSDSGYRAGAAIGRGYLGEWKPILSILSNEEPWLHESAVNIVRYWVVQVNDLKEIVKYVERRLKAENESNEPVKAILKRIAEVTREKIAILEAEDI